MEQIGWQRLSSIDSELTRLDIRLRYNPIFLYQASRDQANREHIVTVKLPPDYPRSVPECTCDLPVNIELQWHSKTGSISHLLKQYEKVNLFVTRCLQLQ